MAWTTLHGPTLDVTGDTIGDYCDQYTLTLTNRQDGAEHERPTMIYMNAAQTIQMTATPYWDARIGDTYMLTVSEAKRPRLLELDEVTQLIDVERSAAIKLHQRWTGSTQMAAEAAIDKLNAFVTNVRG